ncbi:MAG: response regulator [Candidatus Rokubacteria bacterium]|nr:response regulator [Candidatus Rokubacteria bacterium]
MEDNEDARESLRTVLEVDGHEVEAVADGHAATEAVGRLEPDIVLIDIGLPDMDGYELARRLRAMPGATRRRLVAVTGYGRPEDRQRALQAGFDAYLIKPVEAERLASLVARL